MGAGSAGSVVANRLSKHNRVLLIEAGGTPFYANHIPAMATALIHTPEVDYMYKTVPQKNGALGSFDQVRITVLHFIRNFLSLQNIGTKINAWFLEFILASWQITRRFKQPKLHDVR